LYQNPFYMFIKMLDEIKKEIAPKKNIFLPKTPPPPPPPPPQNNVLSLVGLKFEIYGFFLG
jgi:hypothetical protein